MALARLRKIFRLLDKAISREPKLWWLAIEVSLALLAARALVGVSPTRLPFRLFESMDGKRSADVSDVELRELTEGIRVCSRVLPGRFVCLPLAVAASFLFWRRRWPLAVSIGLRKEDASIEAHAWTLCGDNMVTGSCSESEFTLLRKWGSTKRPVESARYRCSHPTGGLLRSDARQEL